MKANLINEGVKYGVICGLIALLSVFGSWAAGDATFATVQKYANFMPYMFVIILENLRAGRIKLEPVWNKF